MKYFFIRNKVFVFNVFFVVSFHFYYAYLISLSVSEYFNVVEFVQLFSVVLFYYFFIIKYYLKKIEVLKKPFREVLILSFSSFVFYIFSQIGFMQEIVGSRPQKVYLRDMQSLIQLIIASCAASGAFMYYYPKDVKEKRQFLSKVISKKDRFKSRLEHKKNRFEFVSESERKLKEFECFLYKKRKVVVSDTHYMGNMSFSIIIFFVSIFCLFLLVWSSLDSKVCIEMENALLICALILPPIAPPLTAFLSTFSKIRFKYELYSKYCDTINSFKRELTK
ncbi:hypothetical protein [Thalassospira lucentensis]|uniref:hypothetical protein n=1 Tax=Thalassospira lucentensis TaxID=168935 RepID=UPI003AA8715A